MLRKERKGNNVKCFVKTKKKKKTDKEWKTKIETNNKVNKQETIMNMVHINLTLPIEHSSHTPVNQNSPSQASAIHEPWNSRCSSWF